MPLLDPLIDTGIEKESYEPMHRNLVELNVNGMLLELIGEDILKDINTAFNLLILSKDLVKEDTSSWENEQVQNYELRRISRNES